MRLVKGCCWLRLKGEVRSYEGCGILEARWRALDSKHQEMF
jgi:hypothetical protein